VQVRSPERQLGVMQGAGLRETWESPGILKNCLFPGPEKSLKRKWKSQNFWKFVLFPFFYIEFEIINVFKRKTLKM